MAPGSSGDKENLKMLEKHLFSVDLYLVSILKVFLYFPSHRRGGQQGWR